MSEDVYLGFHEEDDCYLLTVTMPYSDDDSRAKVAFDVELSESAAREHLSDMEEKLE